jgi:hypothetical protein
VKVRRDNKSEKHGEGEFNQDVFVMGNNFKIKYEQLLETYNVGQCIMVLLNNVIGTYKGDQFLKQGCGCRYSRPSSLINTTNF